MPIEGGRRSKNNQPATYVTIGCMAVLIIGIIVVISFVNFMTANNL